MQEGRYAAKAIRARLKGSVRPPFRYVDKGNVATIGRVKAVIDLKGLRLSGTLAWLAYLFVHLFYLVGLQNRLLAFIRWSASFLTRGRGARLITAQRPHTEGPGTHAQPISRQADPERRTEREQAVAGGRRDVRSSSSTRATACSPPR